MNSRSLRPPRQWQWWGLLPLVCGLYALSLVEGVFSALLAGPPGLLWLLGGLSLLLIPGDPRVTGYLAVGAVAGILLSLPVMLASGFADGLMYLLSAAACFVVSGKVSLMQGVSSDAVPAAEGGLRNEIKVGLDETVLGFFLLAAKVPAGEMAVRTADEAVAWGDLMRERGWDRAPENLHAAPAAPTQVNARAARAHGMDFERISFDSDYQPDPAMPGAAEWQNHEGNRRTNAWMLRHPGPPRPWLVCVHGYRMGESWIDFSLFNPRLLHKRLGMNLLMPTLPLHGPRKAGRLSGARYLDGNLMELVHAQTQALWDLRRWLAWLRDIEDEPRFGLYGVSLGGYNSGLLSGYERDIAFAVASIPVTDFAEVLWGVMPPQHRQYFAARGLTEDRYRELLRPVSPLTRPTLLPEARRHVVAATADRIVPVAQPTLLARHWGVECNWYQGSHISVAHEFEPRMALEQAMKSAGWDIPSGTHG